MKNLILIAILLLSTSVMSQTIVLLSDFQYDQGVESMFTVMYMPDDSLKGAILLEDFQASTASINSFNFASPLNYVLIVFKFNLIF